MSLQSKELTYKSLLGKFVSTNLSLFDYGNLNYINCIDSQINMLIGKAWTLTWSTSFLVSRIQDFRNFEIEQILSIALKHIW